jgi:predicted Zn finger-like uncharacterized protein
MVICPNCDYAFFSEDAKKVQGGDIKCPNCNQVINQNENEKNCNTAEPHR